MSGNGGLGGASGALGLRILGGGGGLIPILGGIACPEGGSGNLAGPSPGFLFIYSLLNIIIPQAFPTFDNRYFGTPLKSATFFFKFDPAFFRLEVLLSSKILIL